MAVDHNQVHAGERRRYGPDDDAQAVEAALGGAWVVDWETLAVQLMTGRYRAPIALAESARRSIISLAQQDQAGEVDDSYARTGDAENAIQRWCEAAAQARDIALVELIESIGVDTAAHV